MAESMESDIYANLAQLVDERIRQELTEWFMNSNEVKIFITGKTGVGKSTLINGLLGKRVAKEGESLDPETSEVKAYESIHDSIHVTVWDSPGLQDGTSKEAQYLADMKAKCSNMDTSIYCVNMMQTRFFKGCADVVAMKKLTEVFGKKMWKNAMFALTFANLADEMDTAILEADDEETKVRLFTERIKLWKKTLVGALVDEIHLRKEVAERIEVVPVGHATGPALLDRPHWLSPFWFAALYAMHSRAQPAMVKLNYNRIVKRREEIRDEDLENFIQKQPLIFSQRGALIGAKYGVSGSGKNIGSSMGLQLALEIHSSCPEDY